MEWIPLKLTQPSYSGYYEVKIRVQLDIFEDESEAEAKSVKTAWFDLTKGVFKEKNSKNSKPIEHISAWRVIEI